MTSKDSLRRSLRIWIPGLIGLIFLFAAGCQTMPPPAAPEKSDMEKLVEQKTRELDDLKAKQAAEREAALRDQQASLMKRVQAMSNYNWEASFANGRNPAKSRWTQLVDLNTSLVAANSPVPPDAAFVNEARDRVITAESKELTDAQVELIYKGKYEEAQKQLDEYRTKQKTIEDLAAKQRTDLATATTELTDTQQKALDQQKAETARVQEELRRKAATDKFYKQLIWIFGGCSAACVALAVLFLWKANFRMAIYAGIGASLFLGCSVLTIWLSENRWVIWVFFGGGVLAAAGSFIVRHGWNVRDNQLRLMIAKRDTLQRMLEKSGQKLTDFGFRANETINDLDVQDLETLEEKLKACLKQSTV